MIIQLLDQSVIDRLFVSTPERQQAIATAGHTSTFVPLAYHPCMGSDRSGPRDIDVLFLGNIKDDRAQKLLRIERSLAREGFTLHVNTGPLYGDARTALLNRCRVSLGLSGVEREFVRFRALCSMACGAVFVSEKAGDPQPFEPGRHFVWEEARELPGSLNAYLTDEAALGRIRDAATSHVRRFTLAESVRTLLVH